MATSVHGAWRRELPSVSAEEPQLHAACRPLSVVTASCLCWVPRCLPPVFYSTLPTACTQPVSCRLPAAWLCRAWWRRAFWPMKSSCVSLMISIAPLVIFVAMLSACPDAMQQGSLAADYNMHRASHPTAKCFKPTSTGSSTAQVSATA